METLFLLMIMYSFGLFGLAIGKIIKLKQKNKHSIIDWDKPKEFWENDIKDFRYHHGQSKHK